MNPNVISSPTPGSPSLNHAQPPRARGGVRITNPNTHEPVVFNKNSTESSPSIPKQEPVSTSLGSEVEKTSGKKLAFKEAIAKKKEEAEKAAAEAAAAEKKAAAEREAAEKKAAAEAAAKAEAEKQAAAKAELEAKAIREAAEARAKKAELAKKAYEASQKELSNQQPNDAFIEEQITAAIAGVNDRISANTSAGNKITNNPLHLLEKAYRPTAKEVSKLTYPEDFKKSSISSEHEDVYLYNIEFLFQFQNICVFPPKAQWENIQKRVNITQQLSGSVAGKGGFSRNNSSRNFNNDMGKFGIRGERPAPGSNMGGFQMSMNGKTSRMGSVTNLNSMNYKSGRQNSSRRRGTDRSGSNRGNRDNSMHMNHRNTTNKDNATFSFDSLDNEVKPPEENKEPVAPIKRSANAWVPRIRNKAPASEDGKLSPEEVQRKVKSLLNKMTLDNFEIITDEILVISNQSKEEKDGRTLRQVIELTFAKAVDEAHWSNMYARFCAKMLNKVDPEIYDETILDSNGQYFKGGVLFRKYLLSRCQEDFERGWSDKIPTNPDGSPLDPELMSDEYYELMGAKRRGLGLIRFIGELYFLGMLSEHIIERCIRRLLKNDKPSEEVIESICQLLTTVGKNLDVPKKKLEVDIYFDRLLEFQEMKGLASRLRFMIMDVIDLRKGGWVSDAQDKGPKTMAEIHEEAQAKQREKDNERRKNTRVRNTGNNHTISSSDMWQLRNFNNTAGRGDSPISRENSSRGLRKGPAMSAPGIQLSQSSSQRASSQQGSTHNPFMALGEETDANHH